MARDGVCRCRRFRRACRSSRWRCSRWPRCPHRTTRSIATRWAVIALAAAALTLRHAIIQIGHEHARGLFPPAAAVVRHRRAGASAASCAADTRRCATLIAIAGALHPTTALWFAIWLGVASFVAEPRLRMPLGVARRYRRIRRADWALTLGPLAGRLVTMDDEWLATLAVEGLSLSARVADGRMAGQPRLHSAHRRPLRLPAAMWPARRRGSRHSSRAASPLVVDLRRDRCRSTPRASRSPSSCSRRACSGCSTLLAVDLRRVGRGRRRKPRRAGVAARGNRRGDDRHAVDRLVASTSCSVEFPDRRIAQIDLSDDDWGRAMAWARASPSQEWLARRPGARGALRHEPSRCRRTATSSWRRSRTARSGCTIADRDADAGSSRGARRLPRRSRRSGRERWRSTTTCDYLVTEQALPLPVAFSRATCASTCCGSSALQNFAESAV